MKVKTSVTLSAAALRALDLLAGREGNRSKLIEEAILEMVARRARATRDARDAKILARVADALNREMDEVLELQAVT